VRGNYYGEVLSGIADATSAPVARSSPVQTMEAGSFSAEFIGTAGFRPAVAWDHVAGFVVWRTPVDPRYLHALRAARKPVVMVSHEYPDFPCPVVLPANTGIRAAVAHLIAHGHRRIAFVGFVSVSDIRERFQAYVETLRDHGIEPDATLVFATANNAADGGDGAART
jgi:DNA-binding LacI/PurR family transcriptional regulator